VVHHLDRDEARRIAVRAQLLDAPRPTDLLEVIQRLTFLKVDPTAAVAPNADLVLWSRLGSSYRPAQLQRAIEHDRDLFEFNGLIRPMDDLPLYLAGADQVPRYPGTREWYEDNEPFRQDILDLLGDAGPLLSRDIPDTSLVSWPSTGWTNNRNVTQMLEILLRRGEVAVSHRKGRERFWDLAERVYPRLDSVPYEEAIRERDERRLRSFGIARATGTQLPVESITVGEAGEEATIEGVPGTWRVDPAALGQSFEGRTALLSPLDLLVYDRKRMELLWDFEYILEMYKPAKDRRWGFFALPILHHERLVGKVDVVADRKRRTYVLNAIHEDVPFTKELTSAVRTQLEDLAAWQGLELEDAKE
jgi:uncharacterized protein YcaQ